MTYPKPVFLILLSDCTASLFLHFVDTTCFCHHTLDTLHCGTNFLYGATAVFSSKLPERSATGDRLLSIFTPQ